MKIGVRLESLGLPLKRALDEAARLGVAGVQVDAAGDLAPDQLGGTGRREFRNKLRSLNLELTALGCPLRRGLDVAENLQPRIEHARKVLSLSYDLGSRIAIVEMPAVPDEPKEAEAPALSAGGLLLGSAPARLHPAKALREALADLGAYGDRVGATLALEAGLDPAEKLAGYLASFDTGSLGVNYDPANMLLNGHDPIQSLPPLGGKLVHVHARDARRSGTSRGAAEVPLGAGDIDWMAFAAVLESLEYR
ncbi:MAG: sugar phosphate isomerase/epimerase family protein, partial [Gemmataceae bacterium]